MKPVLIQLPCSPGTTYSLAPRLYEREIVSKTYSTSGEFALLAKICIDKKQDIGKFNNDNILNIKGITRSLPPMTSTAF